jgi:hypothetical protein
MESRSCPSGDKAIQAMFFRFSKANVRDLLLIGRQLMLIICAVSLAAFMVKANE